MTALAYCRMRARNCAPSAALPPITGHHWIPSDAIGCLRDQHVHAVRAPNFGCPLAVSGLAAPDLVAQMDRSLAPGQGHACGAVVGDGRRPCALRFQPVNEIRSLLRTDANNIQVAV